MDVVVRREVGMCRGTEVDTGIDGVYLVDSKHPSPGMFIGVAAREKDAPLQLVVNALPEAVVSEARKALDARDFDEAPEKPRRVEVPPMVEDEPEADDE